MHRMKLAVADDIVTRLRAVARPCICMDAVLANCSSCSARLDAADEIKRLRAAIDALLTDIDGDHRPEWSSDEAEAAGKEPWCCAWCGAADGGWPCVHRRALDELKAARRG